MNCNKTNPETLFRTSCLILRVVQFTVLIYLFASGQLFAQSTQSDPAAIPFNSPESHLFGKDIIINNQPIHRQYKVALAYAFNGWIYAAIGYNYDSIHTATYQTILRSIDNGITWLVVSDTYVPDGPDPKLNSIDLLVTGDSEANLKVIMGLVNSIGQTNIGVGYVYVFDAISGEFLYQLGGYGQCTYLALATDILFPSANSNPHSIGILYSKYTPDGDSVILRTSNNGGLSMDSKQIVRVLTQHCGKVSLAFGRSPSWSSGRYFAAWEEKSATDFDALGHIYTSHSIPNFNSPFTTPVNLDSLNPADINLCKNPSIACQYNNTDNDSANLTEVVLFERHNSSNYDIKGYYNLQAAITSHFNSLTIGASGNMNLQPDITFNPYQNIFMVTYFDSSQHRLPFLKNDFNLTTPNSWTLVSSGYNDLPDLSEPIPVVEINPLLQDGVNAWIAKPSSGKPVALFDYPASTWTNIINQNSDCNVRVYPNPCSSLVYFDVEDPKPEEVIINIYTISGKNLGTISNKDTFRTNHILKYDVSSLPTGMYLFNMQSVSFSKSGKILVNR
jgi:hypothetical protein